MCVTTFTIIYIYSSQKKTQDAHSCQKIKNVYQFSNPAEILIFSLISVTLTPSISKGAVTFTKPMNDETELKVFEICTSYAFLVSVYIQVYLFQRY